MKCVMEFKRKPKGCAEKKYNFITENKKYNIVLYSTLQCVVVFNKLY